MHANTLLLPFYFAIFKITCTVSLKAYFIIITVFSFISNHDAHIPKYTFSKAVLFHRACVESSELASVISSTYLR